MKEPNFLSRMSQVSSWKFELVNTALDRDDAKKHGVPELVVIRRQERNRADTIKQKSIGGAGLCAWEQDQRHAHPGGGIHPPVSAPCAPKDFQRGAKQAASLRLAFPLAPANRFVHRP